MPTYSTVVPFVGLLKIHMYDYCGFFIIAVFPVIKAFSGILALEDALKRLHLNYRYKYTQSFFSQNQPCVISHSNYLWLLYFIGSLIGFSGDVLCGILFHGKQIHVMIYKL